MESLSTYLKKRIERSISSFYPIKNVLFESVFFDNEEEVQNLGLLLEMQYSPIPGFKKYGYRMDIPFGEQRPGNQKHMHIYVKGKQVFAINADGTAHDGYHKVKIPTEIVPFLMNKGITIPPNNIIECIVSPQRQEYLEEQASISHNRTISLLKEIGRVAIVITNESINSVDVKCNSKVKGHYNHVNYLMKTSESSLSEIHHVIQQLFIEAGKDYKTIEIKNSYYISDNNNKLFLVWSK